MFCNNFVYFGIVLVSCTKENLATLHRSSRGLAPNYGDDFLGKFWKTCGCFFNRQWSKDLMSWRQMYIRHTGWPDEFAKNRPKCGPNPFFVRPNSWPFYLGKYKHKTLGCICNFRLHKVNIHHSSKLAKFRPIWSPWRDDRIVASIA
jgi:hypothetical protein